MKRFAHLYAELDSAHRTAEKVEALVAYLRDAPPRDAAWAVHLLSGRRWKRLIDSRKLWQWAVEESGLPEWLAGECYDAVGDTAETIALILPPPRAAADLPLDEWIEQRLLPLRHCDDAKRREVTLEAWRALDEPSRLVWNKLLTGAFRAGVSRSLVARALAEVSGLGPSAIAHRLMGDWQPTEDFAARFLNQDLRDTEISRPYPFCLAQSLDAAPESLGAIGDWLIEWKWDGLRCQLVRRGWRTFLWSHGEDLITERFPEIAALGAVIGEGTVLDGVLLPWKDGAPVAGAKLQPRAGGKPLPAALLADDLLECEGQDVRRRPLEWRRERLAALAAKAGRNAPLLLSPRLEAASWDEAAALRSRSRERGAEGLLLKRLGSPYPAGDWRTWKVEPYSVDAVLLYAARGSGSRAGLYTDYTFGVWDAEGKLVPFAKADSGLSDEEIRPVDAFVRRNAIERFGPVRTVKPELVFELAFEAIQESARHKSGLVVRFPRIARWRAGKKPRDADTLENVRALLPKP